MKNLLDTALRWIRRIWSITGPDRSEDIEYARNYARQQVRGGYENREFIIALIDEWIKDDKLNFLSAKKIVDNEINQLVTEQRTWPEITDYDRLHDAMQELSANGIVARENFSCCQNCGRAEITDEINAQIAAGETPRGYAFFHEQGTDSAIDGYGVCLSYGSAVWNESFSDDIKVGHQIVKTMENNELDVEWDGTIEKRICVNLSWQRRWKTNKRDA